MPRTHANQGFGKVNEAPTLRCITQSAGKSGDSCTQWQLQPALKMTKPE